VEYLTNAKVALMSVHTAAKLMVSWCVLVNTTKLAKGVLLGPYLQHVIFYVAYKRLQLGNCDKFYFTFEFKYQMSV
jgi:hypothetical protein